MVVMVDGISDAHVGRKVRVAGRMLTYDPELALVLLYDAECALLVDVQLCIHAEALLAPPEDRTTDAGRSGGDSDAGRLVRWARERKSYVWVLGHLERTQPLAIPELPAFCPRPRIDPGRVLRAVIVARAPGLDVGRLREGLAGVAATGDKIRFH